MFRSGLLVLTAPLGHLHSKIPDILTKASKYVKDKLYVHIAPSVGLQHPAKGFQQQLPCTNSVKKLITGMYMQSSRFSSCLDLRILLDNISDRKDGLVSFKHLDECDVVLTDFSKQRAEIFTDFIKHVFPSLSTEQIEFLDETLERNASGLCEEHFKTYSNVVLGGTFDRLHTGHKILLSESCLLCQKRLTIGVTDGEMNSKKTLGEMMQPLDVRIACLREFLQEVKPSIEYNIVPINDPFGPSIVDPDLECIVVSQETINGGKAVNSKRNERGLSQLDVSVIEMAEDVNHSPEEEEKISSSSSRNRLLGTLLKAVQSFKHSLPKTPYIIGLTGGIASGKSSVCRRLEKLGAGIVDCDKLGHLAYVKGTPTYQKVVEEFGEDIVGADGEINRRALGGKVFSDKTALTRLNNIVWPAIAELAHKKIEEFKVEGKSVVVLDAAVLLEAGWDNMTHEVWVSVIPKQEAVKRIIERNKLSEEQALQRINSQVSNQERVDKANVVLSTLWEPEITQKQVEKAWGLLQERITAS